MLYVCAGQPGYEARGEIARSVDRVKVPLGVLLEVRDLTDGLLRWSSRNADVLAAPPALVPGLVVIGGLDGRVVAHHAATGRPEWDAALGSAVVAAPVLAGETAVAAAGDGLVALALGDGSPIAGRPTTTARRAVAPRDAPG